jgi:Cu/Ag efflux protein CusF
MNKLLITAGFAIAAAVTWPAGAQTKATVVGTAPGMAGAVQTVSIVATITAVDKQTRDITLKGPQGNEVTFTAGPDVKNFDNLKVGDQVKADYTEALTLELKKGGGLVVQRTDKAAVAGAKPGELPAGAGGRQITIVADVIAVDAAKQTIALKGPQRTVELRIPNPEQFKKISKGDQVEATFTQAVAIAVQPAAPK